MSEYLKSLQENILLNESFFSMPRPQRQLSEEDFADMIDANDERLTETGLATTVPDLLMLIYRKIKADKTGALPDVGNIVSKIAESPATPYVLGAAIGIAAALYTKKMLMAKAKCKNAPDKEACKKALKNNALQAKISIIDAAKKKCTNSKCVSKANSKIEKIKNKMKK